MSTINFKDFKTAVQRQFLEMQKYNLYITAIDKEEIWDKYLESFPEGTNPIFRERTEHDCSCCRHFIKTIGGIVAIKDDKLISLWDIKIDGFYQNVADALSKYVKSYAIENIFLHNEKSVGTDKNYEALDNGQKTWEHFYLQLPQKIVADNKSIGTKLSEARAYHDVFKRSLEEISDDAIDIVQDLISQNSLYRGAEKENLVNAFKQMKIKYDQLKTHGNKEIFIWDSVLSPNNFVCKIRNDVIGTLLIDISEGKDLEIAVKSFEDKVSGTNYQRPTALITPKMKEAAKEKLIKLGLMSSLDRRFAVPEDINVKNVIYVNRNIAKKIDGDIFDEIPTANKPANYNKVEEVPIEKFIADIVPSINSIEVMLENKHSGNLVSLIAPSDLTAKSIFKWDNPFSWSYNGDVADSIKERVKKVGGNVEGDVCCRLSWNNSDDLDLRMDELTQRQKYKISYLNRRHLSPRGGMLDIDANGSDGPVQFPCENIFYLSKKTMLEGSYILSVHQFTKRNSNNFGFEVEIEVEGKVWHYSYPKIVRQDELIRVAELIVDNNNNIKVNSFLESQETTKRIWNIDTNQFHKVSMMLLSPNYWDNAVGNKHYLFILEGCINDKDARGFYNEFLINELSEHRKTMEMIGCVAKAEQTDNQLSGLGFSSTQRNSLLCKVSGSFNRMIKIIF